VKTKLIMALSAVFAGASLWRSQPTKRAKEEPSYSASQAALEAAEAKRNRRAERNRRLANEQG